MISQQQINHIVKILIREIRPEKIILFGSHAKGNQGTDSDLDLLIVKESSVPRYRRGREVRKHLRGMDIPIDILVYTSEEIEKWKDVQQAFITQIIREGIVLYEQT